MKKNKSMNKKNIYGKANYSEQLITVVKIAVIVVIVLVLVYLATALATGEIKLNNNSKTETEEATIQYEEIIAGTILNRQEDEYYVLLFNFTDNNASYYLSLRNSYLENDDALPMYMVDLDKGFNNAINANEEETYKEKPTKISDLKVKGPTILKVKKGKVTSRIETSEKVTDKLKELAK